VLTTWRAGDFLPYLGRDRWEIRDILGGPGRSGMGIVYAVFDREAHGVYAAKTFQDNVFVRNPTVASRFMQEASAWIRLGVHENITEACFTREIEGKLYLARQIVGPGPTNANKKAPSYSEVEDQASGTDSLQAATS
jgi:hypothetical protein